MRVKIEKLVYGGDGLAHSDGTTLFVPFVLPGEEVEVTATERSKRFARCRLESVLTPSADRIEPVCPHYGVCGGCHYQHISYEAQLHFKEEILRETLRRLGHLDLHHPITVHASPPFGYRNRAQWKIRPLENRSRRPLERSGDGQSLGVGYFRAASSVLCPVETCAVLSPTLSSVLDALRRGFTDHSLPEEIQEVEAFADAEDQKLLLNVSCSSMRTTKKTVFEKLSQEIAGIESVLLRESRGESMELKGPGFLHCRVGDKRFRVGHLSFFQVNRHVLESLAHTVATSAGSGKLVFDLYAGVGLLSAFLMDNFATVEAVEADPAAARDLEVNAPANGKNISSHNQSAETFLSQWKRKQGAKSPDVIVVDPPRAGLESGALRALLDISAPRIIYVSCDPSTLARDLAQLCSKMYKVKEIHLFDMFPQTYHIESLVRLERAS
ncbi:MAG TPA: 23S rRNA (uracil(1939)-C(5))-methyltransferase RlmD [Candidatus Acidoferrales bacterium]|nr:23S rRNA (uracil(1939)-C(5))-methyltransferase RlmD [Candidatus Acidoferrales bacterium]